MDVPSSLRGATTLTAEYRTPFAVHAHLEAQAALADVQGDRVRGPALHPGAEFGAWCCRQGAGRGREAGRGDPTDVGGGFGRKVGDEVAIEAARLVQASGAPVHVGWTRTEDMRYGYFRPPIHHQLAASLDADGKLAAIEHRQASGDVAFAFLLNFLGSHYGRRLWRLPRRAARSAMPCPTSRQLPIAPSCPFAPAGGVASACSPMSSL